MITFDSSPTVYWLLGYILAGIVILSALFKKLPLPVFLLLVVSLLVFMRLPALVLNRELNPDESQMLSHAITLYQDPVYWRSVDGTTIGPLDNYLLVIPRIFGFQIDYVSGRIMGFMCVAGALLLLFFTLKNWFGDIYARRVILTPLLFLSFTQEFDFVHYSSEQLPVFLLALAIWIFSKTTQLIGSSNINNYLLGLTLGIVPFAKLQAVPQAVVITVAAIWVGFKWYQQTKKIKPLLMLIAGGISFPAITLMWAMYHHVFNDFVDFYLLGNVIYAGGSDSKPILVQLMQIVDASPDFSTFAYIMFIPVLAGAGLAVVELRKSSDFILFAVPVTILALVIASIYAVTKSGNAFVHYLNFCIIPWTLLAAYGIKRFHKWALVIPCMIMVWFVANDAVSYKKDRKLNNLISVNATRLKKSPVVKELEKYTQTKDYMVVWGWQCMYYVEAQLAQGTAENHSERSIFKHNLSGKYRNRYFSDMERTKPAVFIDAVGKNSSWVQDKKTQGFESFPALAQYVNVNYEFVGEFNDTRLYIRKDRL